MKKTRKAIISLVLMLLMAMSLTSTAFAASPTIEFKGFSEGFDLQPGSEYTKTDLFGDFRGVMPGDTVTETITFTNSATDCDMVDLYMRAVPHDETANPLSPAVAAETTAADVAEFLSQLSMKVWNGKELIYEATPDKLDGLKENQFLGTFRTGDTAQLRVELSVPLDLDNKFANRVGEVDWVFHVEAFNETQLSVRKVWSNGNDRHEGGFVTVNLLKDGKVEKTQVLNAENNWAYTFDGLRDKYKWTVVEAETPKGYEAVYDTVGTLTTITNERTSYPPQDPDNALDITVHKVWKNDAGKDRPDSVTVTLYNGNMVYDSVRLGEWNNWTYSWRDPSALGNWQVLETNIPKGYVPSYSVSNGVVTITNSPGLLQTGQLNWPIWVLGGAGLVLVALGGAMLLKKKRSNA